MTARTPRRPRGTPTVPLNVFILPEAKKRIDDVCALANLPIWAVVEAAIFAAETDPETGIPVGWDLPDLRGTSLPGMSDGGGAVRSSP